MSTRTHARTHLATSWTVTNIQYSSTTFTGVPQGSHANTPHRSHGITRTAHVTCHHMAWWVRRAEGRRRAKEKEQATNKVSILPPPLITTPHEPRPLGPARQLYAVPQQFTHPSTRLSTVSRSISRVENRVDFPPPSFST